MAFFMALFGKSLLAQSSYKISQSKSNDMKLSGTSTLHNWTMDAKSFTGDAQFGFTAGGENVLTSVKSLAFSLAVQNLKSDSKGLDNNAYKALKAKQYKNITYKLLSATALPVKDNKYLMKTIGSLNIAGVTKVVAMDVYCFINKDETITCTGTDKLKMTDYQVKPPSFMLGAMTTGDELTLDFTLVYNK
jgi:polyisoprenoid-binding protein YceI